MKSLCGKMVGQAVPYLNGVSVIFIVLQYLCDLAWANKNGFFAESLGTDFRILKLRCTAGVLTADNDVMSITIFNGTSQNKMAWVSKGREPSTGNLSMDKNLFLAGGLSLGHYRPANLEILLIEYESHIEQKFGCNVTVLSKEAEFKTTTWIVAINKTVSATTEGSTTPGQFTDAPYRIGAIKEKEIDTGSLPMTVLIVMLVLISVLLFLAVFLLLHRYRKLSMPCHHRRDGREQPLCPGALPPIAVVSAGRCQSRDEELYRPPAYCLAPDHHLDWVENGSSMKSKGSARTLNSRSHYSIAAHHLHMPLPPIPQSNVPRRGKTYRRPPSVGSSVKVPYVQPQDAIGQESSEDGEITALSSGSPKVHYKSPRDRPTRQNSPLYACVPVSSTDE